MNFQELEILVLAALLHDIGKNTSFGLRQVGF